MAFRIQIRRDTLTTWTVNNPILLDGEFGYVTNTSRIKIGDGTTPWNDLEYWNPSGVINASVYKDGIEVLAGVTGFNFTGAAVYGITGSDGFANITITSNGTSGTSGVTGPTGSSGSSGTSGVTGPQGPQGDPGPVLQLETFRCNVKGASQAISAGVATLIDTSIIFNTLTSPFSIVASSFSINCDNPKYFQINALLSVTSDSATANTYKLEVVGPSGAVATSWTHIDSGANTKYATVQVDLVLQFDEFSNTYEFLFESTSDSTIAGGYSSYICGHTI
jgi:hypothetical protein